MNCSEIEPLIEAVAAGDLTPEPAVAAHLETCARCRLAHEHAVGLERLLKGRSAPEAPPQFTSRAMARVRRDRWQREQFLDAGFNVTVALLALATVTGAIVLLYATGLGAIVNAMIELFASSAAELGRRIAPSLLGYGAATALVASALALWWWAERDLTM